MADVQKRGFKDAVRCKFCNKPTSNTGTKICDGCWGVSVRLEDFLKHPKGRTFVRQRLLRAEATAVKGKVWKKHHPRSGRPHGHYESA